MKTKNILLIVAAIIIIPIIFIGGLITGDLYNVTDILCPTSAEPYILENEFKSNEGIIIPKGTIVPIRNCEYMQRIDYQFIIDKSVKLNEYNGIPPDNYGFSELYASE